MTTPVRDERVLLSCSFELPPDFRERDILAFHNRDTLAIAEQVDGRTFRKGLAWNGHAACLTIRFRDRCADAELAIDGNASTVGLDSLISMVQRMLGLTQQIEGFEQTYRDHSPLGALIARQSGLRVPLAATPFEALTWAVTGQQISVKAAITLRRKLIMAAGLKHSGGLSCYPDAGHIAGLTMLDLHQAGFSQRKAQTLITISEMVLENRLPLDSWMVDSPPVDQIHEQLLRIRGIGPWTINYALLRGFGWLDGSLHGDVAVRRGLQLLLGVSEKITEDKAKQWLADFSPWRALIAAHLWAFSQPDIEDK